MAQISSCTFSLPTFKFLNMGSTIDHASDVVTNITIKRDHLPSGNLSNIESKGCTLHDFGNMTKKHIDDMENISDNDRWQLLLATSILVGNMPFSYGTLDLLDISCLSSNSTITEDPLNCATYNLGRTHGYVGADIVPPSEVLSKHVMKNKTSSDKKNIEQSIKNCHESFKSGDLAFTVSHINQASNTQLFQEHKLDFASVNDCLFTHITACEQPEQKADQAPQDPKYQLRAVSLNETWQPNITIQCGHTTVEFDKSKSIGSKTINRISDIKSEDLKCKTIKINCLNTSTIKTSHLDLTTDGLESIQDFIITGTSDINLTPISFLIFLKSAVVNASKVYQGAKNAINLCLLFGNAINLVLTAYYLLGLIEVNLRLHGDNVGSLLSFASACFELSQKLNNSFVKQANTDCNFKDIMTQICNNTKECFAKLTLNLMQDDPAYKEISMLRDKFEMLLDKIKNVDNELAIRVLAIRKLLKVYREDVNIRHRAQIQLDKCLSSMLEW